MVNITHKNNTLRKAIASAIVKCSAQQTIDAVQQHKVAKGDVFEFSRAAGLLAIKKTSALIPDCHPLPIEFASITYSVEGLNIIITVEVHTIYKTGVEVEAMHGASVVALTIYDMLKPIDKGIEISTIKLISKEGGKSGLKKIPATLKCAVIVCSDTIAKGEKKDTAGKAIIDKLKEYGFESGVYDIIADEAELIKAKVISVSNDGYDLILFTGGTGVSPRDVTADVIKPLLDKEIPGIMETARNYGQQRMPYAMLSGGVAGFIKDSLVITLPGSKKGVMETMDALFPQVLHVFSVKKGERHD
ncbi:MAG TPA: bifunctional molybdenum cofactor biosynthesis protein MoaC/MoaB [Chitinophagaceae bacterium]|jgi:cyclic pyranopterin monophosphate synthase|nr:bifunctional molybdenum cofactor biosynthesis protein MoaC/MoaB [Chitinophagaceae bacterium]